MTILFRDCFKVLQNDFTHLFRLRLFHTTRNAVLIAKHATVRASQLRNKDGNGEMLHGAKVISGMV
jgi:hypothetical protein